MEFKYRATDEQRSTFTLPQPSNSTYFTDQSARAGHMGPVYVGPGNLGVPGFMPVNEYYRNPIEMNGAVWREIEKERIRAELIAEEIQRRRILEAEVRRELMIERELAMLTGGDRSFFPAPPSSMRFQVRGLPAPPLHHRAEGRFLEEQGGMSFEERLGMSAMLRHAFGDRETTSFQRQRTSELKISEVTPASEINNEKEEIVLPVNPEASFPGVKRKAEILSSVDVSELPSANGPKKKLREEWSCALCQVSATSERGLSEHLQGKKHKAKEAGLKNNGKKFSIGLHPKKIAKPSKLEENANNPCSEIEMNVAETEKLGSSLQAERNSADAKTDNVPLVSRDQQLGDSVKNNDAPVKIRKKMRAHKKMVTFWCEMCQVKAFSEKMMEAHRKGKKHLAKLQEVNQNAGSEPSIQPMQAIQELNVAGGAGKM